MYTSALLVGEILSSLQVPVSPVNYSLLCSLYELLLMYHFSVYLFLALKRDRKCV